MNKKTVGFHFDHCRSFYEQSRKDKIEDLCKALHMSRSTIQKIFSDQLHTPIMSYIRVQKIMLAHTMLHDGVNANDTAIQCGFRDYSSFYRAYMKIYKHAPVNDYRRI